MNKLYYDSAYIKEFEAQVLSCQEGKRDGRSPSLPRRFTRRAAASQRIQGSWEMSG